MLFRLKQTLALFLSLAAFFFLFSQTPTQAFIPQNHAEVKNQISKDYAQAKGELSAELHWLKVNLGYDYLSGAAVAPNSVVNTGGRQVQKWEFGHNALSEADAAKAYQQFMSSKTDVAAISRYTGYKPGRLEKIKQYLFNNKDFTPDEKIAEAWHRLRTGRGTDTDKLLLKHETAEMFLKSRGHSHTAAHNRANRWNWQDAVQPPGEY